MSEKKTKQKNKEFWQPLQAIAGAAQVAALELWTNHGKLWRFFNGIKYERFEMKCIKAALAEYMRQNIKSAMTSGK